jgi:hypothetical protein
MSCLMQASRNGLAEAGSQEMAGLSVESVKSAVKNCLGIFCGILPAPGYIRVMKTNMHAPETDADLSKALASWQVEPRRDPGFRAAVKSRLAAPQGLSWPAYLRQHALPVAAACGLALVVGGWIGHSRARERAAADREQLAESYVRALDARSLTAP